MNNFRWKFGTDIIFGVGEENNIGQYCKEYGSKVLIVHSGELFLEDSGLLEKIRKSLSDSNILFTEQTGVLPNPVINTVREGIKKFRSFDADLVLAVGGGSAIDTAKAIALGVFYNGDVWDMFVGKAQVGRVVPIGVVLTIAAAGSEGSTGSVITNPETNQKLDVINSAIRPTFAVMNPELTLTLPTFQTACGVADILSHAMERYFTDTKNVELTDRLGEAVMKTVVNNGLKLVDNPQDLAARSEIMWAANLAHNGLLDNGRNSCWASHCMGTELSAQYNATHGATISVITPAWMKFIYKANIPRFARFATEVFDVEYNEENPQFTAEKGIEALINFYKRLNMPISLSEIGVNDNSKFEKMAESATRFGTIGCIVKLNTEDVIEIYNTAH